jgi:hypothetical protein
MNRVLLGGLLAGVVINISEFVLNGVVLANDLNSALGRLNLPPISGNAVAVFLLMGFIIGIVTVWLYAAIRPRFGPGATTAAYAGLTVWFVGYVTSTIGNVMMGIFPLRLALIAMVWGLFELVIAAVAGAWPYHEAVEPRITTPPMPA